MSGVFYACIFLEMNNDFCTLLMSFVVFLLYTYLLCFFGSRARKSAKKKVENKEGVYDEPDPVSEEKIFLWFIDVSNVACL